MANLVRQHRCQTVIFGVLLLQVLPQPFYLYYCNQETSETSLNSWILGLQSSSWIFRNYVAGVQVDSLDAAVLLNDFRGNISNGKEPGYPTWKSISACTNWKGVSCDSSGKVTAIDLNNSALSGSIPTTLGSLTNLQTLSLYSNALSGSIPTTLGSLKNLQYLYLSYNALSGSIPTTLGSLTNVQWLFLGYNALSGSIPTTFGSLKNLKYLSLHGNELSGNIPTILGSLKNLTTIWLANNYFTGSVPSKLLNRPYLTFYSNCLTTTSQEQRSTSQCTAFCNAFQSGGPCGGHGTCSRSNSTTSFSCTCDGGYLKETGGFKCVAKGFQLGLVIPDVSITPKRRSPYFRYASSGFSSTTQSFTWSVKLDWDWNKEKAVGEVRDQLQCQSCHAFAAAAAMESAFYILTYARKLAFPKISVQQLLDCPADSGKCSGGWPTNSLDYAASNAMLADVSYPYSGTNRSSCSKPASSVKYTIGSYEAVQFYGWLGLLLAVQQQPVLVHVEGSGAAFQNYVGNIFKDSSCYENGVDHTMLLVGYQLGPNPYWILKNSWGTEWGELGFMKMAITDGDGICGINTLPGYIPIFLKVDDPCNLNSFAKIAVTGSEDNGQPGRMNPCGGHTCIPGKKGSALRNTCKCAESGGYFVAANNIDGTQTCVLASPCTFTDTNPCGIGRCLDLKLGSAASGKYSCLCPIGYLEIILTTTGAPTCVPAASVVGIRSYKVPTGATVTCEDMYQLYGLTIAEFLKQNPGVDCKKPFPVGKVLNTSSTYLRGCEVSYVVQKGDNCKRLETLFGITAARLKSANPSLNCSVTTLLTGQLICLQRYRNNAVVPSMPVCTKHKRVSFEVLNCATIISSLFPKNATKFFNLNPGLNCNNLKPKASVLTADGKNSYEICVEASDFGALKKGCGSKYVPFKLSSHTCQKIYKVYFGNNQSLFLKANKNISCRILFRLARIVYAKTNRVIGFCRP